jgi:hypothetical protein
MGRVHTKPTLSITKESASKGREALSKFTGLRDVSNSFPLLSILSSAALIPENQLNFADAIAAREEYRKSSVELNG